MSDKEYPVRLRGGERNGFGATHWNVTLDTSMDGRGRGGLAVRIDVHTQKEGLCIAGNYISWNDLHKAKEYATRHDEEMQQQLR